ncbi:hypothetical protein F4820DRAFT_463330 [Hypoxylon rubiginosum]|uniref:Uncharacterized protein n=1 Tax=Hypoxylon rubiginosum TaxID=110542 RepID=A0ACB9ZHX7_9PEZI|nr:hypothetical protein F4820DRAFT_463330 [Hypoxylon rubiginosum]
MQQYIRLAALAAFLLCQTRLAASYDAPHIWPLDPWKINSLQVTAPAPGHPGTVMSIALAIENPNTVSAGPAPHASGGGYLSFAPSAANCTTSAAASGGALVYTQARCAETTEFSYGAFAVGGVVADPRRFELAFNLNYNVTRWGSVWYKVYDAAARFEVGVNLAEGVYDRESGTYSYELMRNSTPVLVRPTMTECKGYCQMPPTNASAGAA